MARQPQQAPEPPAPGRPEQRQQKRHAADRLLQRHEHRTAGGIPQASDDSGRSAAWYRAF